MRLVAEFVMQSRSRAIVSAVAVAFVPFLSMISAAIVALVWLRMGREEGLKLLAWVCLPGFYYLFAHSSPDVLITLLITALLADILRSSQNWVQVLTTATALAALIAMGFQWLPDQIQEDFIGFLVKQGNLAGYESLTPEDQQRLEVVLGRLLNGIITTVQLAMILVGLFLARWWQALLYHPGGFQQEFHALRMPSWYAVTLALALLALSFGVDVLIPLIPVLLLPLLISGLALVHGLVGIKQYNQFWLGMMYVLLLFALPYMSVLLVLIAVADSLMNFRQRLASS